MEKLKQKLESIIKEYITRFEKKQGMYFSDWTGPSGSVALIGDFYFNFSDIRYDLETDRPAELILDWYSYAIEQDNDYIGYEKWCESKSSGIE
jgi:hypothetical protein